MLLPLLIILHCYYMHSSNPYVEGQKLWAIDSTQLSSGEMDLFEAMLTKCKININWTPSPPMSCLDEAPRYMVLLYDSHTTSDEWPRADDPRVRIPLGIVQHRHVNTLGIGRQFHYVSDICTVRLLEPLPTLLEQSLPQGKVSAVDLLVTLVNHLLMRHDNYILIDGIYGGPHSAPAVEGISSPLPPLRPLRGDATGVDHPPQPTRPPFVQLSMRIDEPSTSDHVTGSQLLDQLIKKAQEENVEAALYGPPSNRIAVFTFPFVNQHDSKGPILLRTPAGMKSRLDPAAFTPITSAQHRKAPAIKNEVEEGEEEENDKEAEDGDFQLSSIGQLKVVIVAAPLKKKPYRQ